jgi:ABC-type nitrate/sulfonate/bicarbonate transport system substrate-binding protein
MRCQGFISVCLVVTALLISAIADAQERLRVGLSSVSATQGAMWVAEERGLFKKYGIDPEVIVIGGGASLVVSSLLAGEIQFSVGGGDAVIRAALKGADTVLAVSPLKTGLQRLMTRSEIRTPADLRGKKIGVTRFGSASHWVLQMFLRKWNMRNDDVQILQLGSSPANLASLDNRAIDGAVLTLPTFFLAEERGYRLFADPADLDIVYLQNSIDTTRGYLRRNRDQAVRFIKGYCEGLAYFRKNKHDSIAVMQKKLRIQSAQEKDLKYLEMSYNLLASKFYNQIPYATPKAVETTLDFVAIDDPKAKGADAKLFLDESIVRELELSGFFKMLYEGEYR